jgi:hypothetical protein
MNRREFSMKRLLLGLLLGLFVAGLVGCMRPEPVREEVIEQTDQTIKGPWEEQMPGTDQ